MGLRGHNPVNLENFQGIWQRGDPSNCPLDHLDDAGNFEYVGDNLQTRPGLGLSLDVAVPLEDIKREYNYPTQTANTKLILTYDGSNGKIYHVVDENTRFLILTVAGMTDFAFVPYAGRAYISPFGTFDTGDINIQKGLSGEFLYVYLGDGIAARKAAGPVPAGALTIANGAAGHTDAGLKVFGVVGETDSGFLSRPIALNSFTTSAGSSVSFGTVPVFAGTQWTKRHIVASISIAAFNGNLEGYPLFFIPGATIPNNTSLFLNDISFYDEELIDDASHLFDNYTEIPAGAALWFYHDRLHLATTFTDISLVLVSAVGEPEAISQIDGLIIVPLDGNPITNGQELRDIDYIFKRTRTVGYVDNGEEPSNWPMTVIDNSIGTCVHGIATVLDSGSSSVDYLIVASYAGVLLFNGRYILPELSFKIQGLWLSQDRNRFRFIQIVNSPINKRLYIVIPDGRILIGDYANGFDWKKIRWTYMHFWVFVNCICIVNIDELNIGADLVL
jgi:hypothetical protein